MKKFRPERELLYQLSYKVEFMLRAKVALLRFTADIEN